MALGILCCHILQEKMMRKRDNEAFHSLDCNHNVAV